MPYIRKQTAGSDSLGHTWEHDGDVVEMPHEEAEQLLAIPDGGFTLADGPSDPQSDAPVGTPEEPVGDDQDVTEPEPPADEAVTEEQPARAAARRGRKPAAGSED